MYNHILKTVSLVLFLSIVHIIQINSQVNDTLIQIGDSIGYQKEALKDTFQLANIDLFYDNDGVFLKSENDGITHFSLNNEAYFLETKNQKVYLPLEIDHTGKLIFLKSSSAESKLVHVARLNDTQYRIRNIPFFLSIVPPIIAILLALIFKEVVVSLFAGIWSGAFILGGLRIDSLYYFLLSIWQSVQKFTVAALTDSGHISVIIFSLMIGGMVAVISKNGGMAGIVLSLSRYATTARSTQFVTWLLGILIFFDDYANTLIVGNTMKPVSDKYFISREKLAYIVDSTAAPVASIAFITTWIGAELGYIDGAFSKLDIDLNLTPYAIFLQSLKYSYYPILTLVFILILIYLKRDFGSMFQAEQRARNGQVSSANSLAEDEPNMEDLSPVKGASPRWYNAALPVLTVIFVTIFGLLDTGFESIYGSLGNANIPFSWSAIWQQLPSTLPEGDAGFVSKLGKVIGSADSYIALIWASLSGLFVAILLTVSGRIMKLFDTMHWVITGFKTMIPALVILSLAWSLAAVSDQLFTADYISSALQGNVSPFLMPILIFILAAFISFSTGSSWSTMAILYPIAIPATYAVCLAANMDASHTLELLFSVVSTVLAASVLGDHCSPISDTTILSSLASDCNHIDHVRTQMPYALTVGLVSLVCVAISSWLAGGLIVNLIVLMVAIAVLYFVVLKIGKKVDV